MSFALVIDGVLVLLLGVAIYYGAILNRRLAALRSGESEMRAKLDEFSAAVSRAESALAELKGLAPAGGQTAHAAADGDLATRSEILRDDLRYLLERGEALLRRVSFVAKADVEPPSPATNAPEAPIAAAPAAPAPRAGPGQALRRAVQAGLPPAGPRRTEPAR